MNSTAQTQSHMSPIDPKKRRSSQSILNEVENNISIIKKIIDHTISPEMWKQTIDKMSNQSFKSLAILIVNLEKIIYNNNNSINTDLSPTIDSFHPEIVENPESRLIFVQNCLENIDRLLSIKEKVEFTKKMPIEGRLLKINQQIAEMPPLAELDQPDMSNELLNIGKETLTFEYNSTQTQFLLSKVNFLASIYDRNINWINQMKRT